MKEWYSAVCDVHKERVCIFVSNPSVTAAYLSDHDESIQLWLELHWQCGLRLIHRDDEIEQVNEAGYERVKF